MYDYNVNIRHTLFKAYAASTLVYKNLVEEMDFYVLSQNSFLHLLHFELKLGHFYGGDGGLFALVAQFATRTGLGLLEGVGGEHTEYKWDVVGHIQLGESVRYALADVVEMACFALNHTAQTYHRIKIAIFGHELGSQGEFKCTWNMLNCNVFGLSTML